MSVEQKLEICQRVGPDWKRLGRLLAFDDSRLEQWKEENKDDLTELNHCILTQWERDQDTEASREALAKIFDKNLKRGDLADILADS